MTNDKGFCQRLLSTVFVKGFWPMLYDKGKPKSENRQQAACFAPTTRFAAN
jgi:hypothetical protein